MNNNEFRLFILFKIYLIRKPQINIGAQTMSAPVKIIATMLLNTTIVAYK